MRLKDSFGLFVGHSAAVIGDPLKLGGSGFRHGYPNLTG
jgi:hypothetical protein